MKREFIYIGIIISLSVFSFQTCNNFKDYKAVVKQNETTEKDSLDFYKNKLGLEVAEKQSYITRNKNLKDLIDKKDKQLVEATKKWKSILAAAKVAQRVKIDTVKIPFSNPVDFTFSRPFEKSTEYYYIQGLATNLGIDINQFKSFNTQTIVFGEKRIGLFKTEIRAEITNSNPFITTTSLDSWQYVVKEKRFGVSVFGGYVLTPNFTFTPAIGIGVSYDLFRF